MAMVIATNMASLTTQHYVVDSQAKLQQSMQKISSGLRINTAQDDASGLAISRRMEADVRGMDVAMRNAADGISLAQTVENGWSQIGDMLQRMRELAVQSANGTLSSSDRSNLNGEFVEQGKEIYRVIQTLEFNGKKILAIDAETAPLSTTVGGHSYTIQVGQDSNSNQQIVIEATAGFYAINKGSMGTHLLVGSGDLNGIMDITSQSNALSAIGKIDHAIDGVTTERARFGAVQSRFQSAIAVLQGSSQQTAAAKGRIVDTDYAAETANLAKLQILQQAGVAMLAQANQSPQSVLSLLQ